jgi:myo-inositol 2-dehydrogenase / D-chiro-inositol 1-dehydrogenase
MTVRVGVIGAGIMGADHANTLRRSVRGAEVTAVADVDRGRAEDAAAGARVHEDAFALIADPAVDAVVIASPDSVHAAQVVAAVRAGKAVLCEKPLAPTLAEGRQVLREIGATGEALLSLGFMRRFDPGYVQLRQAIDDGPVGAPVLVHNVSRGVSSAPNATSEFSITGSAIHEFDIVPWLLRSPVVEVSWVAPRRSSQANEGLQDPQLIHLRTADGVLSTVETFLNARYGYVVRCEVVGEAGTISLTEPARVVVEGELRRSTGYAADWRPRFADAYRIELQAWVDSVLAGAPTPLATGRDGVAANAVAEAVIASMHDGGRVTKVEQS